MRRVWLRLALFLLPILAGWLVLEIWLARVPTSHSVKRRNLEQVASGVDTLILGSSGAYWDIVPEDLPGTAFNLGNVAQTLYYDDRLASLLLPKLPRLKRVIIAIPYVSMFFQLQGTDEEERQYYYYQEWGIPPPRLKERVDLRMWSGVALRTPQFAVDSLRIALSGLVRHGRLTPPPVDPPVDERGWCAREAGDPRDLTPAVVARKLDYHHGLMHLADEAANLAALEHLAGLLHARGVELIIVTPPVWPEYAAGMRADYWHRAQADFERLGHEYGVQYVSFLDTPELGAAEFLDADHLNAIGARHFTRLLVAALKRTDPASGQGPGGSPELTGAAAIARCVAGPCRPDSHLRTGPS